VEHPSALWRASRVLGRRSRHGRFYRSTSAIIDWCAHQDAPEFIVMTESGVGHSLQRLRRRRSSISCPMRTAIAASARICAGTRWKTARRAEEPVAARRIAARYYRSGEASRLSVCCCEVMRPLCMSHGARTRACRVETRRCGRSGIDTSVDAARQGHAPTKHTRALPLTNALIDTFGRLHDSLRISVTDRCNIRCFYCMPETAVKFEARAQLLSFEEIERFVSIVASWRSQASRDGRRTAAPEKLSTLIRKLSAIEALRIWP